MQFCKTVLKTGALQKIKHSEQPRKRVIKTGIKKHPLPSWEWCNGECPTASAHSGADPTTVSQSHPACVAELTDGGVHGRATISQSPPLGCSLASQLGRHSSWWYALLTHRRKEPGWGPLCVQRFSSPVQNHPYWDSYYSYYSLDSLFESTLYRPYSYILRNCVELTHDFTVVDLVINTNSLHFPNFPSVLLLLLGIYH